MLDNGANLTTNEHFAGTALHAAARAGHVPVLKLLVSRGAPTSGFGLR